MSIALAPGGSAAPISRKYAELPEKQLKVRVIVENKPGAPATIGSGAAILMAGFLARHRAAFADAMAQESSL